MSMILWLLKSGVMAEASYEQGVHVNNNKRRLSKKANEDAKEWATTTGEMPWRQWGCPMKWDWDCSFCFEELGSDFYARRHWMRTHFKCRRNADLFYEYDKQGAGKLVCPVKTCKKYMYGSKYILKKHLKDKKVHTVVELLKEGVDLWIYRPNDKVSAKQAAVWLERKGFIKIVDPMMIDTRPVEQVLRVTRPEPGYLCKRQRVEQ